MRERGIDYDPLVEPLRVFVGVDDSQLVAARVLEYTIRKHASCPVRFIPMIDVPSPQPKDPANRARTGFSFSRFHIPRLAGFRGRGVYMDADMQVFADVAELLERDMGSHTLLCTRQDEPPPAWKDNDWFHPGRQMSVMVLDCERLRWDVDEIIAGMDRGEYGYADLLFDMCIVPEEQIDDSLPPAWNHLEHYEPGETRLLHYTVVPTQPWKSDANPLRELWERAFTEAQAAGLIYPSEVRLAVRAGHVKRSLAGLPPASLPVRCSIAAARSSRPAREPPWTGSPAAPSRAVDAARAVSAKATQGEELELWLDSTKIKLFDPSDGRSLTATGDGPTTANQPPPRGRARPSYFSSRRRSRIWVSSHEGFSISWRTRSRMPSSQSWVFRSM